jgi:hypothetical protein
MQSCHNEHSEKDLCYCDADTLTVFISRQGKLAPVSQAIYRCGEDSGLTEGRTKHMYSVEPLTRTEIFRCCGFPFGFVLVGCEKLVEHKEGDSGFPVSGMSFARFRDLTAFKAI